MFTKALLQEIAGVVNERVRPLNVEGSLEDWGAVFTFRKDGVKVHEARFTTWDLVNMGTYGVVEALIGEGRYARKLAEGEPPRYEPPMLFVDGLPIQVGGDRTPPIATLLEVFDRLSAEEQERLLTDLFYGMM